MTIDQLKVLITTPIGQDDLLNMVNHAIEQRDDALARIATADSDKAKALADAKTASDAALAAQIATDATAQTAAIVAAVTPLNAEIATLTASLATANTTIAQLETTVAGSAGAYQILVSPIDEAALQLEAAAEGISVAALIIRDSGFDAAAIASKHKLTLLQTALQRYVIATDGVKAEILAMLGLSDFATSTLAAQMKALQSMALDAFNALPPDQENQIFVLLGIV